MYRCLITAQKQLFTDVLKQPVFNKIGQAIMACPINYLAKLMII